MKRRREGGGGREKERREEEGGVVRLGIWDYTDVLPCKRRKRELWLTGRSPSVAQQPKACYASSPSPLPQGPQLPLPKP